VTRLERFFFPEVSERPMAYMRTVLGLILLIQALSFSSQLFELYGDSGILQGSLAHYLTGGELGIRALFARLGISETLWLRFLFTAYTLSLLGLVVNFGGRVTAGIACLTHTGLLQIGTLASYGVDQFAQVALFYLILCPGTDVYAPPSRWTGFVRRLLQINLALAYLCSGLAKARGADWWTGEAIWRALMMPVYRTIPMEWLAGFPLLAKLLCWGTLLLEIGYIVFIWPRATRKLWVVGVVGLHLGILVFMRLTSFALVMTLLTVVAFGLAP
jgi:hypothetical protein